METLKQIYYRNNLVQKLFMRTGNIAVYEVHLDEEDARVCGYEVIIVTVLPAKEAFGKTYPEREHYPGNNDFGTLGFSCSTLDQAKKLFADLVDLQSKAADRAGTPEHTIPGDRDVTHFNRFFDRGTGLHYEIINRKAIKNGSVVLCKLFMTEGADCGYDVSVCIHNMLPSPGAWGRFAWSFDSHEAAIGKFNSIGGHYRPPFRKGKDAVTSRFPEADRAFKQFMRRYADKYRVREGEDRIWKLLCPKGEIEPFTFPAVTHLMCYQSFQSYNMVTNFKKRLPEYCKVTQGPTIDDDSKSTSSEIVFIFPVEKLDEIAVLVEAYKKWHLTGDTLERARKNMSRINNAS